MADPRPRARVGVLISGRGSNMAALLYASRAADCPYEIAIVIANDPVTQYPLKDRVGNGRAGTVPSCRI